MRYLPSIATTIGSLTLVVILLGPTSLRGQEAAEVDAAATQADAKSLAPDQSVPDNARNILTDADRVLYLAAKLAHAAELREFAAEHAQNQEVKQMAQQAAQVLEQHATLLEQAASQHAALRPAGQRAAGATDPDLSETVEEIGEAVRERLRQRAERRGEQDALEEPELTDDSREADSRRARGDRRDNRLVGGADRDARRERLRVLLPALREELPDLFEVLGEAVEDETVGAAAWVDYQQKVAQRVLQAKQEELNHYDGREFDQAALGMMLVEAIELQAIAKTVAEQATPSLKEIIGTTVGQLRAQAEESRQLMEQAYQREGAQISSTQRSTGQSAAK